LFCCSSSHNPFYVSAPDEERTDITNYLQQFAGQGGYFVPQVFQGAIENRSLVTVPSTASTPVTTFINTSPAGSASAVPPPASATPAVGAPPNLSTRMETSDASDTSPESDQEEKKVYRAGCKPVHKHHESKKP
jgi:hypothetical protein